MKLDHSTIPKLPGCNLKSDYTDRNHRSQRFVYSLATPVERHNDEVSAKAFTISDDLLTKIQNDPSFRLDKTKPTMTHDERAAAKEAQRNTYRPNNMPAWLAQDRQVLRAYCYYTENICESNSEKFRGHLCVIHYFLEDGTTEVSEPAVSNSGIPQGVLVKRHMCNKMDGSPFGPADLKMGGTVSIYSRSYKITGMDKFTQEWLRAHDLEIGEPCDAPIDDYTARVEAKAFHDSQPLPAEVAQDKHYRACMLGAGNPNGKLEQFLKNDGKVLRFYCYWDDKTRYGGRSFYILHYFLADNTIEVLESYCRNAGRDTFPVFSKRGDLFKVVLSSCVPGMFDESKVPRVTMNDLIVGETIDVRGREFFIYDCDAATRGWCKENLGIEHKKIEIEQPKMVKPTLPLPPWNGIGDEKDSEGSVFKLMPKPPRQDMVKLMVNSDTILRFEAVMDNCAAEDLNRRFIVLFYPMNDSTMVFEMRTRNSGQSEGKFADRAKRKNPHTGEWFKMEDFFVGALVAICAVPFHLLRADEYSLKYMEGNPEIFPLSDKEKICARLSACKDQIAAACAGQAKIEPDMLREIAEACGCPLIDQELITLIRHMVSAEKSDGGSLDLEELMSMIQ